MLYHNHIEHAPVRTKKFWALYKNAKTKNDLQDAWVTTEAFRLTFKRK